MKKFIVHCTRAGEIYTDIPKKLVKALDKASKEYFKEERRKEHAAKISGNNDHTHNK